MDEAPCVCILPYAVLESNGVERYAPRFKIYIQKITADSGLD